MRRDVASGNNAALKRQVAELTEQLRLMKRLIRGTSQRAQRAERRADLLRTVLVAKAVLTDADLRDGETRTADPVVR